MRTVIIIDWEQGVWKTDVQGSMNELMDHIRDILLPRGVNAARWEYADGDALSRLEESYRYLLSVHRSAPDGKNEEVVDRAIEILEGK